MLDISGPFVIQALWRSLAAALTSALFVLSLGSITIRLLQRLQMGQVIRTVGPQSHLSKKGTPTMGGVLILLGILFGVVLWAPFSAELLLCVLTMLGFGLIGWLDDYRKVVLKNSRGLPARWKYLLQSIFGLAIGLYLVMFASPSHALSAGLFVRETFWQGLGCLFFYYFVIVGSSNAVNLTDGLDGLVIGPVIFVSLGLLVIALSVGNMGLAWYLHIPYVPGALNLLILCGSIAGAGLGFLWFNAYPARLFMGDVGALALGAVLGVIAILLGHAFLFALMGTIFVIETISVILQVGFFRLSGGKRIFKMAPIHHHFELSGWPEPKVVWRAWVFCALCVILALAFFYAPR